MTEPFKLGQAFVSKVTNGDGPEVSANGGTPSPMPIERGEWLRRYRQRFMDVAGLSAGQAEDCANAVTFEEASDSYEDDPEGAADMEMSYWDGD